MSPPDRAEGDYRSAQHEAAPVSPPSCPKGGSEVRSTKVPVRERSEPSDAPSRRGFLGVAAAGIGGVMLAPGIRLIEIAQAADAPARARKCAGAC